MTPLMTHSQLRALYARAHRARAHSIDPALTAARLADNETAIRITREYATAMAIEGHTGLAAYAFGEAASWEGRR